MSKNHCLKQLGFILQGEYEGAGAPSCGIKCLQTACASRRLRRAAADFRAAERPENRGIVKASKKSVGLFRQPERRGIRLYFSLFLMLAQVRFLDLFV
ncbi:hypothetical protein, partial [Dysosmobacter sp.]|uniref:hypothetical protein n=1 Tax=Dysosmobacter sp. TaxID=2591382 RepID=UPI002DBBFB46